MIFQLGIPIFTNFLKDEEEKEQGQDTTRQEKGENPFQDVRLKDLEQDTSAANPFKDVIITDLDEAFAEMQRRERVGEEALRREALQAFSETGDVRELTPELAEALGQAQAAFAPDQLGSAINRSRDRSILEAIEDITPVALPVMALGGMGGAVLGLLAADDEGRKLLDPSIPLPPQNLDEILEESIGTAQQGALIHEGFVPPPGLQTGVPLTEQEIIDTFGAADPTGQLASEEMQVQGFFSSRGGPLGATVRSTLSLNRQLENDFLGTTLQLVSAPLVIGYMGTREFMQNATIPNVATDPRMFRLEELRQRWLDDIGRLTPYESAEARRGMTALLATAAFSSAVAVGIGPGGIFRTQFAKGLAQRGAGLGRTETIEALNIMGLEGLEAATMTPRLITQVGQTARFLDAAGGLSTFGFFSAAPGEKMNRAVTFAMAAVGLYGTLAFFDWGLGPIAYQGVGRSARNPRRAHAIARLGSGGRPFDRTTGPIPDINVDTGAIPMGTNVIVRETVPLAEVPPAGGEASILTPPPRPRTGPNTTLDVVSHPDYVMRRSAEDAARMQARRIGDPGIPDPAPISSSAIERARNRGLVRQQMIPGDRRVPVVATNFESSADQVQSSLSSFASLSVERRLTTPEEHQIPDASIERLKARVTAEGIARASSAREIQVILAEVAPELQGETIELMARDLHQMNRETQGVTSGRRVEERRDIVSNARERELGGRRQDINKVVNSLRGLLSPELSDFLLRDSFVSAFMDARTREAQLDLVRELLETDIRIRNATLGENEQNLIIEELVDRIIREGQQRIIQETMQMLETVQETGEVPSGPADVDAIVVGDRSGRERRQADTRREEDIERREEPEGRLADADIRNLADPRSLALFALQRAEGNVQAAIEIIGQGIMPGLEAEGGEILRLTQAALDFIARETRGQEVVETFLGRQVTERRTGRGREISRGDILAFEASLLSPEQLEAMAVQADIEQRSAQVEILGEEGAAEFNALQDIIDTGTNAEKAEAQRILAETLARLTPSQRSQVELIASSDAFGIDLLDAGRLRALANVRNAHSLESMQELDVIELIDILREEIINNDATTGLKGAESFIKMEGAFQALVEPRTNGGKGLSLNDINNRIAEDILAANPGMIIEDAQAQVARRSEDMRRAFNRLESVPRRVNAPESLVPADIAEDVAIWFENQGDPIGALVDELRTKDNQTVVVSGVDTPGRVLELARERLGENIAIAIHRRDVGDVFDVGLGGDGSPFQLPHLRIQFEAEGNFAGQEISVDGMRYEYISRGKRSLGEDPNDIIVRSDPAGIPFPISRSIIRNIRDVRSINEFDKVAIAQRGLPERGALRIRDAEISPTYTWLAEHTGDLTRIMSEAIVVEKGDFSKSLVTVDRMIEQLEDVQGTLVKINQEIAENSIVRSRPEITDEMRTALVNGRQLETITERGSSLQPAEVHDLSRLKQLGRDYAAFHKQIPTINRVQRLAQDAAVAIGEFRFDLALDRLRILQAELGKGRANWEKVTAQSTTPTLEQVIEGILDPAEVKAHTALRKELAPPTSKKLLEDGWRFTFENMRKLASNNNFILDRNPSGAYTLRDQTGGGDVFASPNIREIEEFIRNSGQFKESVDFDAAHSVDPNVPGSTTPPPPANHRPGDSFPVEPEGYLESLVETATAMLPWIAPFRDWAAATDAVTGTKIFRNVWKDTNLKAFEAAAMAEPWFKDLEKLNNAIIKSRISPERWESLRVALTTRSEAQLRSSHLQGGSFVKHRDYNPVELSLADELITLDVSMQRVHNYLDTLLAEWKEAATNAGVGIDDLPTDIAEAIDNRVIGALNVTPQEVEAMKIFMVIRNSDVADISGYGIERLVSAHRDGSLSAEDYMNQESFTAQERAWVEEYRRLYDMVAADPRVPISDVQLLLGYEAHVGWRQKASPENAFNGQPGGDQEMRFIHNMIRQGEGNPYDQNPTINLANYMRAASRAASGFNEAWNKANRYVQSLPDGQAKTVAEGYLGAVRGNLPAEAREAQKLFDKWLEKMGWDVDLSLRNDVINTVLAINSGALIGFRYGLTLRDLTSWLTFHYARFGGSPAPSQNILRRGVENLGIGPSRTIRALRLGFTNFWDTANELRKNGTIPSVGPIQFETPSELMSTGLGRELLRLPKRLRDFATFGFVMGGQKNMYEALFTGSYLESKEFVGEALVRFENNAITKEQLYEVIKLNSFNKQVRAEFDELINLNQFENANEFLGRMSGIDMLGLYGMANHPRGWGTNPGRLVAQYGNWPASMMQTFLGGMTRGSGKRQLGFATRFFMGQGAMWATGRTFGMDFGTWFVFPGLFFLGGPLAQTAEDFVTVFASNAPDTVKNRAKYSLRRFWPEVDLDDPRNTDFRTMWFPSSYFINDFLEARRAFQEGKPVVQAVGEFFNIPISKKNSVYFDGANFFNQ